MKAVDLTMAFLWHCRHLTGEPRSVLVSRIACSHWVIKGAPGALAIGQMARTAFSRSGAATHMRTRVARDAVTVSDDRTARLASPSARGDLESGPSYVQKL